MSEAAPAVRFLRFARGATTFALPSSSVLGVAAAPRVTRVPGAPAQVLGLFGWRGQVLPLVDAETRSANSGVAAALVVSSEGGAFALAADRVEGWADHAGGTQLLEPAGVYQRVRALIRRGASETESDRDKGPG